MQYLKNFISFDRTFNLKSNLTTRNSLVANEMSLVRISFIVTTASVATRKIENINLPRTERLKSIWKL